MYRESRPHFDKIELYEMKLQELQNDPDHTLCDACQETVITLRQYNLNDGYCKQCYIDMGYNDDEPYKE